MRYSKTVSGIFIERPNRFVAYVEIDGKEERCHVKNTGRCKELLIPGANVILNRSDDEGRSTKYDLISVYKENMLVNMDSQAPNKVIIESINKIPGFETIDLIRSEYIYGDSRIDVFAKYGNKNKLMEIKGVTLEKDGIALFPDAPTERGLKHVRELENSLRDGYEAYLLFLIQMRGPKTFSPNYQMHDEFAAEVEKAYQTGVKVLAFDSVVTKDSILLGRPIGIDLNYHS